MKFNNIFYLVHPKYYFNVQFLEIINEIFYDLFS